MYKEPERPFYWVLDSTPLPAQSGRTVVSPLHYGETAELVFTQGIEGEITIDNRRYILQPKTALFIPPRVLHTSVFRKGGEHSEDRIRAFHVNLHRLQDFLDLHKLLQLDGRTLHTFPIYQQEYDVLWELVQKLCNEALSFSTRTACLLALFETMSRSSEERGTEEAYPRCAPQITDWLETHYTSHVSLDQAAADFGYNKYYFCKWIKAQTGVSFGHLLNATRIHYAASDLLNGYSVANAAYRNGFSDPSYFAKVFRQMMGITPTAYPKRHKTKR